MLLRGILCLAITALTCSVAPSAEWGLKQGDVDLQSAGSMTFGPDGILLVGDSKAASVYAIDTGDHEGSPQKVSFNVANLGGKLASLLGTSPQETSVGDLAVNPLSGNVYLSVKAGDKTSLVKVSPNGKLETVSLKGVPHAKATRRTPRAITCILR